MTQPFNVLNLIYSIVEEINAPVFVTPPTDIVDRMPALLLDASAPVATANLNRPGYGANVTVTLTALADDYDVAFELCSQAYSLMYAKRNVVTDFGWVTRVADVQAPFLTPSDQVPQGVSQVMCVLDCVIRK